MISDVIRVSPAWLALREPVDAAARSGALVRRLAGQLPPGPLVVHDLGGGSGSMGRWLAPRLERPQHWVVHDRDGDLLERAVAAPPAGVTVEAWMGDLAELTDGDLAGGDLIVASALLDLLTADALEHLLTVSAGRPLLLALSVTGCVTLTPGDPLDASLQAAFNAHQRRDGRLGPDAVTAVAGAIAAPSPWRLGRRDAALMAEWLDGWIGAACEQEPALADAAEGYRERRRAQLAAGALTVTVDHADLLVLP